MERFIRMTVLGQLSQKGVYIEAAKKPSASKDLVLNSNARSLINGLMVGLQNGPNVSCHPVEY